MPSRPLPKSLVERLRKVHATKIKQPDGDMYMDQFVGRLTNIDPRQRQVSHPRRDISGWGRRVREMDVSKNYPKIKKVVIKAHHQKTGEKYVSAHDAIQTVRKVVMDFNKKYKNDPFVIKVPHGYAIGKEFIAMGKVSFPTIDEMIGKYNPQTKRGRKFFEALQQKHKSNPLVTREKLLEIDKIILARTKANKSVIFDAENLFCLGIRRGKLILVPAIDLF